MLTTTTLMILLAQPVPVRVEQDEAVEFILDEDYRFRLDLPGPGWILVDRNDALAFSPHAVAGAALMDEGLLMSLVFAERLPGLDLREAARRSCASLQNTEVEPCEFEMGEYAGRPAVFYSAIGRRASGNQFHCEGTVFRNGDYVFDLRTEMPAKQMLHDATPGRLFLDAFTILDGEVSGRPNTTPGPGHEQEVDDDVGADFVLRGGVYRDFRFGMDWTKPTPSWRAHVASVADGEDDARLIAREPELGIELTVHVRRTGGPLEMRHEFADLLPPLPEGAKKPRARRMRLGGIDALSTTVETGVGKDDLTWRLVTAWCGEYEFEYHVLVRAPAPKSRPVRKAIETALDAFSVSDAPRPTFVLERGRYRDDRLGFELRQPRGKWVPLPDLLPEKYRSNGAGYGWGGPERRSVTAMAFAIGDKMDSTAFQDPVMSPLGESLQDVEPVEDHLTFADFPCRRRTFRSGELAEDFLTFKRGIVRYFLTIRSVDGSPSLGDVRKLFELLP